MISAQVSSPTSKRRKLSIEVYFVLYLSAITLLLGTAPPTKTVVDNLSEEAIAQLVGSDFRLDAERAALIYAIVPAGLNLDSTTSAHVRRDSVNTIRALGDVENVRFQIAAIHDTSSGQALPIDQASLVREGDRTVMFRWNPSATAKRNAVYRVVVYATASPVIPSSLVKSELRDHVAQVLKKRGPLTDSVTFTVNIFEARSATQIMQATSLVPRVVDTTGRSASTSPPGAFAPLGPTSSSLFQNPSAQPFSAAAGDNVVRTVPGSDWKNRVMIFGVGNAQRDVTVQCSPGARIAAMTENYVDVVGSPATAGREQISVTVTRKSDARKSIVTFDVKTAPLDRPRLPNELYAGQSAELNFSTSEVGPGQISVEVYENDKLVLTRDNSSAVMQYATQATTGNVRFQRYLSERLIDKWVIPIKQLPFPRVDQPTEKADGEAIVKTTSYGSYRGRPNKAVLKVEQGNAEDPDELTDRYAYDPVSLAHTQYWRIRRSHPGTFQFSTYALDTRGSGYKSSVVKFFGKN